MSICEDNVLLYRKITKYIDDINQIQKVSQQIIQCRDLYNFLISNEESISLLKSNNKLYKVCLQKLPELLYHNISKNEYNKIYQKLKEIGESEIKILEYSDNGNQINKLSL